MRIETEIHDVTEAGVNIGVHIHKEQLGKVKDIPEELNVIFRDIYETMEIVSILKSLKDNNEVAFSHAMDIFNEEELSEVKEDEDNE